MMTKKISVLFAVIILTAGYAQAQFNFGLKAGFNLTNMSEKYDGEKPDKDDRGNFKPGFQIGLIGELSLSDAFAIQPGIVFATQGTTYKGSWDDEYSKGEGKEKMNLNYIQIPINAQYKMDLGGMKLLLQAGPYLGYGIGGKYKSEYTEDGETEKGDGKIKFGKRDENSEDYETAYIPNAFDFGIGLGAGLQFDNIQVVVGYNIGLANMTDVDKASMKNNGLAFTVAYLF